MSEDVQNVDSAEESTQQSVAEETTQLAEENQSIGLDQLASDARNEAEAKSQREILANELQNLTKAAARSSLLFFAPNLDEIAEKARAEREARKEALEAERRQRRLAEITHDEDEVVSRRRRRRRRTCWWTPRRRGRRPPRAPRRRGRASGRSARAGWRGAPWAARA